MSSPDLPLPTAELETRRQQWLWLIPLLALCASAALLYASYQQRGIPVTLRFQEGYGLKPGDALRYRGIEVGRVHGIDLTPDLHSIEVEVRLFPSARDVAREGSRFWIVRPELGLSGASGLETLVGANYLRVLPGQGTFRDTFTGLETPPLLELLEPGGLEVVLTTPGQGNLRRGAPLSYRQVVIGTILSVDLARDAGSVEARVYINPKYAHLIREDSHFWKVSGAKFSAGWLSGLSFQIDSVESLLAGGVVMAIPPMPGEPVANGHRFFLHDDPEEGWLQWRPYLLDAPSGKVPPRPEPVAASLRWTYKNWLSRWHKGRRDGWVLPVAEGFLGPADLLAAPDSAKVESTLLHLGEERIALHQVNVEDYAPGLKLLPYRHNFPSWPMLRRRAVKTPEDSFIGTDFRAAARFVSREQCRAVDGFWELDALNLGPRWHGAAVVAASDGALLGFVLFKEEEGARVALLQNAPP